MKLLKTLLTGLGMIAGLVIFYFVISIGYYNFHVRVQKILGRSNREVDDGAAANFGQILFSIWALTFIAAVYYFYKFNWYDLHPEITSAYATGSFWFLFGGLLGACFPVDR